MIEQHIKHHTSSGAGTGQLCWNPRIYIYSLHWSMRLSERIQSMHRASSLKQMQQAYDSACLEFKHM
jgi:hypothetical protein